MLKKAGLFLALTAPLGAWVIHWGGVEPTAPYGDMLTWSSEAQKRAVCGVLNATVKLRGFKISVHDVRMGENFWGIAQRHHIDLDTICGFNPELPELNARLGQPLLIPTLRGALYQVTEGDSIPGLALSFGVKANDIEAANELGIFGLRPGQLLFIPGAAPRRLSRNLAAAFKKRKLFRSPLAGKLTSMMGVRHDPFNGSPSLHNGIDIRGHYGDFVGAAAAGTVVFAGWNGGFGKCVKLDHHNGYVTLYGHLNSIQARLGQRVRRHQLIGRVGATGRATGPHLHFTIYLQGHAVDPLQYLW